MAFGYADQQHQETQRNTNPLRTDAAEAVAALLLWPMSSGPAFSSPEDAVGERIGRAVVEGGASAAGVDSPREILVRKSNAAF